MLKIDCNVVGIESTNKPGKKKVRCVGSSSKEDYGLGAATLSFVIDNRETDQYPVGRAISWTI